MSKSAHVAPGRVLRCCLAGVVLAAACRAHASASGPGAQRVVLADFEDVGTWRLTGSEGLAPGAWFAGTVFLGSSRVTAATGEFGGEIRYRFDPVADGARRLSFRREKMRRLTGFIDGIEFAADARGGAGAVRFMLMDAAKKRFGVAAARIEGEGWRRHRIAINADTVKNFTAMRFPVLVDEIVFTLDADQPASGAMFIDDIAATGTFTRGDTLSIRPVYDGLAHPPGAEAKARYRLRSGLPEPVRRVVRWTVDEAGGGRVAALEREVELPAFGETEVEFSAGRPPVGAYEAELRVEHSGVEVTYQDTFAVFAPNGRRLNRSPMWFGVQDNTVWQAEEENRLHLGWMRALGIDLNRLGTTSGRFRPDQPLSLEGWRALLTPISEAGIDTTLLFFETPAALAPAAGVRAAPTDLAAFERYAEDYGRFFSGFAGVRYVEFWNEPDIGFFRGTIDEYKGMFSAFSRGMRRGAPGVLIGTGGVTVLHPREKKDFSARMYQESGDDYDLAVFHAHGSLANYVERQRMVEGWLSEAGLRRPIANAESGERSGYTAAGRHRQAMEVVKKMAYSKARASEFHIWFTLQDYWDMDPEADDSFGLVTSDNRAKPSFVAYNELIRRLANTAPLVARAPDDVEVHGFRREDGRHVYVAWPAGGRSGAALRLRASAPVELVGLYGRALGGLPASVGRVHALGAEPVYLESDAALEFLRPEEMPLTAPSEIHRDAAAATSFEARLRNPRDVELRGRVSLADPSGAVVWSRPVELAPRAEIALHPVLPPAPAAEAPITRYTLGLETDPVGELAMELPVLVAASHPIDRVAPGEFDRVAPGLAPIVLREAKDVFELSFDPAIPAWRDPSDLSVDARLAHDGENLVLRVDVADDKHVQSHTDDQLWRGDSLQLAFYEPAGRAHVLLDLGLAKDGPVLWCHKGPDAPGRWAAPVSIRRQGDTTRYEATIPLGRLGFPDGVRAGSPIRFALLVNEDDGQGRVRWMHWAGGLGKNQDVENLGHGILK